MRLRTLREAVETAAALVEQALELTTCEDQVLFYRHLARLRRLLEGWR